MKKCSPRAKPEIESPITQQVSDVPKHQIRWSRGVATCSCGYWTLWGASLESARRSHGLHRRNRAEVEGDPVGHNSAQEEL